MNFIERYAIKYFEKKPSAVDFFKNSKKDYAKKLVSSILKFLVIITLGKALYDLSSFLVLYVFIALVISLWLASGLLEENMGNNVDEYLGDGAYLLLGFAVTFFFPVVFGLLNKDFSKQNMFPFMFFYILLAFLVVTILIIKVPYFQRYHGLIKKIFSFLPDNIRLFYLKSFEGGLKILILLSKRHDHIKREIIEGSKITAIQLKHKKETFYFDRDYFLSKSHLLEPPVKRFIDQRIDNSYSGFSDALAILAFILPKSLSVDAKIQILQNAVNSSLNNFIGFYSLNNFIETPSLLDGFWGNMTENQIKRVMTGSCNYDDLMVMVFKYISDGVIPQHQASCFYDFHGGASKRVLINPLLRDIKSLDFSFKVLESKVDFLNAREDFKNCVRSYFESPELDVVCFYQDKVPVACVSVNKNLNIEEIKSPLNKPVSPDMENKIKEEITKIKKLKKESLKLNAG